MQTKRKPHFWILLFPILLFYSCIKVKQDKQITRGDLPSILKSDTLKIGTLYGSTSYFNFKDDIMGYDYELAISLAKHLKLKLKTIIAKNENELLQLLNQGAIDLAAYNFTETNELKKAYTFVLSQSDSYIVLVQQVGSKRISNIEELSGKTIHVKKNSIFHQRAKMLNDEIGRKFKINFVPDSTTNEDLIDMVGYKKIEYTLTYRKTGLLYKNFHKNLDCHLQLGFNQHNGWLIRNNCPILKSTINEWENSIKTIKSRLNSKYWNNSPYFSMRKIWIPLGAISPYDALFKKYAELINWDWRLLASIAYQESRFDKDEISWAGAAGIMQLMPKTAANFGLDKQTVFVPEMNIEAGVQYIKSLNLLFRKITDKEERIKFILASYNSGPSHVIDAIALTNKYGKNPNIWDENVAYYFEKGNEPTYYNDPVVKYGKFRPLESLNYVINTLETFERFKNKTKK
jgi:membrane-bound lytic murein transglycosylase F